MYMVDPHRCRNCDPVRSVFDKIVHGQIRFFGGLKDSVMFGAGLLPLICDSGDDV